MIEHAPSTTVVIERRIERALRAGVRGIQLTTDEEDRALELLEAVAEHLGWPSHAWSATARTGAGDHRPLPELLAELAARTDDALFVLLDAQASLQTPVARRALRELAQRERGPAVVLVEPASSPSPAAPEVLAVALPPPDLDELTQHIRWVTEVLTEHDHPDARARLGPHVPSLARAALGLPRRDVDRVLAEAVLDHGPDPAALLRFIADQKPAALDREGMLELVEPVPAQELGGLPHLKAWLERRALALHPGAAPRGIPAPRGVLLLGVQGCGKSLAARVSGQLLGLPVAVAILYTRGWWRGLAAWSAERPRAWGLVITAATVSLWLLAFGWLTAQPQTEAFARLRTRPATLAQQADHLAHADSIREGLLNAHLSPYRYWGSRGDNVHLARLYRRAFGASDDVMGP
ncbi:MAG: hypothetical protein KDK70_22015, partial [Myxococcales bacterium]|nr:hypothetical protein [Myxococcales bacterium]